MAQLPGKPLWAVIVTIPQDVALLDSRKAVAFSRTIETEVVGIVENMSGFECPYCGKEINLFKMGGGEKSALELGVPYFDRIPFDHEVVRDGDAREPTMFNNPDSKRAKIFKELAFEVDNAH